MLIDFVNTKYMLNVILMQFFLEEKKNFDKKKNQENDI